MSFSSLSPELLPSKPALEANSSGTDIYHCKYLVAVVVDEAHCVTKWYILPGTLTACDCIHEHIHVGVIVFDKSLANTVRSARGLLPRHVNILALTNSSSYC